MTIYVHAELSATSESVAKFLRGHHLEQSGEKIEVKVTDRAQELSQVDPKYRQWTAKQFVSAIASSTMKNLVQSHNSIFRNDQVHIFVTPLDEQSLYEMRIVTEYGGYVIVLIEGVFTPVFMLADSAFEVFASREDLLQDLKDYTRE